MTRNESPRRPSRLGRAVVRGAISASVLAACAAFAGCGSQCERNPDVAPIVWDGGVTNAASGTYVSAPAEGPFLDFPPGRTYRFVHGLGGVPQNQEAWVSYAAYPYGGGAKTADGVTHPSGNQVTYEAVTSEYVDVRNDTCSDVRIRLLLSDPVLGANTPDAAPPSPDGG